MGGLPLGFGGGAPLKKAEIDPSKPPEARGLRPLLLVDLLPGGLPRLGELRGYALLRLVFAK
jgi:hypothetical protein